MPDQPNELTTSSALESDPSLSAYELLAEQLFDRIRIGNRTDESVQSEAQLHQQQSYSAGQVTRRWRGNALAMFRIRGNSDRTYCIGIMTCHGVADLGIQKTLDLVQRQFWWPGIATDAKEPRPIMLQMSK